MADQVNTSGGGSNAGLGVIVGAVLVAVLVLGFFVFGGEFNTGGGGDTDVRIETPATGGGGGGNTGGGGGGQTGQGQ